MSELNREIFEECVAWIKENYPKLKIRIYKSAFTPGGSSGEYMDNKLYIASGPCPQTNKVDWEWIVGTLAHEFSHFLREKRHSKKYNERVYQACYELYDPKEKMNVREAAAYWIINDEYQTDCEAYDIVLRDWDLQHHFKDWFYWANSYNYKIKYLVETGILYSDRVGLVKAPTYKLEKDCLHKPLTRKKKKEIDLLLEQKKITTILVDYDKKVTK